MILILLPCLAALWPGCLSQMAFYSEADMVRYVRQSHALSSADQLLSLKWELRHTLHEIEQKNKLHPRGLHDLPAGVQAERPACKDADLLAELLGFPSQLPDHVCEEMGKWDRQGVNDMCAANLQDMVCALADTIDTVCNGSSVNEAIKKHLWLFRMLDAMGKLQPGVSQGSILKTYGAYDACQAVYAMVPQEGDHLADHIVKGQFCKITFALKTSGSQKDLSNACPNEMEPKPSCGNDMQYGACLPATCTSEDLYMLWHHIAPKYKPLKPVIETIKNRTCHVFFSAEPHVTIWSDFFALSMTIFCILVLLVMIFGTIYDYFIYQPTLRKLAARQKSNALLKNQRRNVNDEMDKIEVSSQQDLGPTKEEYIYYLAWYWKALMAFSVYTNGFKIMTTQRREGTIECVHGIRVLSMAWVMLGHTYYFAVGFIENPVTQLQLPTEYFFQMINNATVSVDTFFVMSGFLLTYLFLKRMKSTKGAQLKSPKFWIMYYVHRYIRLTPVYMIVILLGYAFWDYLGVGPMWAGRDESVVLKFCPSSWWHNALYINNLFKFGEQCIGWTWYLANDMQFYWISPPLLLALYYQPWFALGAIGLLIAASDFVRGYVTVEEGFPPTVTVSVKPLKWANPDFSEEVYQRPYMRISTYLVGVLLGWLLYARDGRNNGPTRGWALLSWVATFVLSELVLFGMFNFARTGDIDVTTRAIYASLFRTAWGVAVAATIYLCVKGAGGPINSFLSWNMWFPLSRLTYCTYLLHEFVLIYIYSTLRSPEYGCHYQSVYVFLSALVMTTALALVFSLAFEAPVMALEKLVFERPKPPAERRVSERHDGGQIAAAQPSAPAPQPPHADV